MNADVVAHLRAEHLRLTAALDASPTPAERVVLKAEIVTLFRTTEAMITELATFKESIRELVDRFKELPSPSAVSVRHDHIGASSWIERGWSALASGEWSAAAAALREACARDATSDTARALLAWAVVRSDDEAALALCRPILETNPDNGLARVAVGVALIRRGQLDDAVVHLRHVLRGTDPRATLYAHYWIGVIALGQHDPTSAVLALRHAVTLGPNLGEGWAELGAALWYLGEYADAREAWLVGEGIRHSMHAARCRELAAVTAAGGMPPRFPPF